MNFFKNKFYTGDRIKKLDKEKDLLWLQRGSQLDKDIDRFSWFSNGYLAIDKNKENTIIDIRYSGLPHEIEGLWGISYQPDSQDKHVSYETLRGDPRKKMPTLWKMIKGLDL